MMNATENCMDHRCTGSKMIEMIDMSHSSKHQSDTHETQMEAQRRFIRNKQRLQGLAMMELDEYEPIANLDKK